LAGEEVPEPKREAEELRKLLLETRHGWETQVARTEFDVSEGAGALIELLGCTLALTRAMFPVQHRLDPRHRAGCRPRLCYLPSMDNDWRLSMPCFVLTEATCG
jgi:hypothetical protein